MTEESMIKSHIKEYLALKGIFNFHLMQGLGSYKGVPDRIIIYKGFTIFCEIKKAKGFQSENQKQFEMDVKRSNGIYIVAKCVEDVINVIEKIDKEIK